MSFSPDEKTLATTSLKVIQLLDVAKFQTSKMGDIVEAGCSRLINSIGESEWQVLFGNDLPYVKLCHGLPIAK